jgi:hypothetical protein
MMFYFKIKLFIDGLYENEIARGRSIPDLKVLLPVTAVRSIHLAGM